MDQILADEQMEWNTGTQEYDIDDILWPLTDHQGTVRDLVELQDGTTKTVQRKSYDANGNVLAVLEPAPGTDILTTINPENATVTHLFGFTGRPSQIDAGLQNNLGRWYDPEIAGWISEDPISFRGGDANLYCYCGNDPVNCVDPSGLWTPEGLAEAYIAKYGERQWLELCAAMSQKGIWVVRQDTWLNDWSFDGTNVVIARDSWCWFERSNENAAEQLNEFAAIHLGVGETTWLYKTGRVARGTGKMIGGMLTTVAGMALTEIIPPVGVAVGVTGIWTMWEGGSQVLGFGEGENGWNPGTVIAGFIGHEIAGDKGEAIGETSYIIVDLGVNVVGLCGNLSNISKVEKFKFVQKYKILCNKKVLSWNLGETITPIGHLVVESSWKMVVVGNSFQIVFAGNAIIEDTRGLRQ